MVLPAERAERRCLAACQSRVERTHPIAPDHWCLWALPSSSLFQSISFSKASRSSGVET